MQLAECKYKKESLRETEAGRDKQREIQRHHPIIWHEESQSPAAAECGKGSRRHQAQQQQNEDQEMHRHAAEWELSHKIQTEGQDPQCSLCLNPYF